MSLQPPQSVEIRESPKRGRGVFATRFIGQGEVIEEAPVLVLQEKLLYSPHGTSQVADYVFIWSSKGLVGLSLGYGSLYNHSYSPNAYYEDTPNDTMLYIALRGIHPGEEITINYNGEPNDDSPVGFDVV